MTTTTYSSLPAFVVIKHLSTIVVLVLGNTTNQNTVTFIWCGKIGCIWNTKVKFVLDSLMTVRTGKYT